MRPHDPDHAPWRAQLEARHGAPVDSPRGPLSHRAGTRPPIPFRRTQVVFWLLPVRIAILVAARRCGHETDPDRLSMFASSALWGPTICGCSADNETTRPCIRSETRTGGRSCLRDDTTDRTGISADLT